MELFLWDLELLDDLKGYDIIETISSEYLKHKRDKLYESAMNIIINANKGKTLALLVENFNLTEQNAEIQMKKYW